MDFDAFELIGEKLHRVPTEYRLAFLLSSLMSFVVFLYFIVHFPAGNHDWKQFLWTNLFIEISTGRWFYFFANLLFGSMRIPVVMHIVLICCLVAASIVSYRIYTDNRSIHLLIAHALFFSIIPYVCTYYYYSAQTAMFGVASLMAALSVYFASRSRESLRCFVLSVFCACACPATYQPHLNAVAVLYCLFMLTLLMRDIEGGAFALGSYVKKVVFPLLPISCGFVLYLVSLNILRKLNIVSVQKYQLQTNTLSESFGRSFDIVQHAFSILHKSQDFIPFYTRYALLLLLVLALGLCIARVVTAKVGLKEKFVSVAIVLMLSFLAVVATKSIFFVSSGRYYSAFRMQSGLALLYAFPVACLPWARIGLVKSVAGALVIFSLISFVQSDLAFQVLEVEQQRYAYDVAYDVAKKIQKQKGFILRKKYKYVQLGDIPKFKQMLYGQRRMNLSPDLSAGDQLIVGGVQLSSKGTLFMHFIPGSRFLNITGAKGFLSMKKSEIKAILDYVDTHDPWPSESGVAILNDSVILVYFDDSLVPEIRGHR